MRQHPDLYGIPARLLIAPPPPGAVAGIEVPGGSIACPPGGETAALAPHSACPSTFGLVRDNQSAPDGAAESHETVACDGSADAVGASPIDSDAFDALGRSLGDSETLASIVTLFLDELDGSLSRMDDLSDVIELRSAAHQLKGSAGMLGAPRLSEACRMLVLAIDERREDDLPGLAAALQEAGREVAVWLWENSGPLGPR